VAYKNVEKHFPMLFLYVIMMHRECSTHHCLRMRIL